jgi:hypothetical protein
MELTEHGLIKKLHTALTHVDEERLGEEDCIEGYADYILSRVMGSKYAEYFISEFFGEFPATHRDLFVHAVLKFKDDPEEAKYVMTDIIYALCWTRSIDETRDLVIKKYLQSRN